jgi:sodium-coupled neutral amino acid transporter 11
MLNGKLAGRSTYQDLMEFAFGRPGLIVISIFQFAFAFGGKKKNDLYSEQFN